MSFHLRASLAALALVLSTGPATAEQVKSVLAGADPDAEMIDGRLWIYPTGPGDRLSAWSAPDGAKWVKRGDLIRQSDIRWIKDDREVKHFLWAPDMVRTATGYHLYYSVGPQDYTPSRLGVATCTGPAGPCADSGKPLLTGGNGFEAIDPAVFVDAKSAKTYLYAGGSAGARLRVFELAPDMLSIAREVAVEQPPHFTEGAFMHERAGVYYLSYSSGKWNASSYQVHYATAASPVGPWTYRGIILQSDKRFKGPGHHSFIVDPKDGSWSIVYHRWEGKHGDGPYTDERRVAIQHISYNADGTIAPVRMTD
jgi:beta-xylosidase